ncbi:MULTISPECIES: leucine zipper domain-containing protein [Caulobacteraceae]|jgi:transposase-like protein|uniref:leucine zipper domain-containing protein n=2 Tax=Caulobacterales TaxID=204458 RepID=UPI000C8FD01C|nr:hypothetical protein [Phenylobacterium sp.]
MPFQECSLMSRLEEFCRPALVPGANVRSLCRGWGVSPTTAQMWLGRFGCEGTAGLADRSRRPRGIPLRSPEAVELAPSSRYAPRARTMLEAVEPLEYEPQSHVRTVSAAGRFTFKGRRIDCSHAFAGKRVALRPTQTAGVFDFCYRTTSSHRSTCERATSKPYTMSPNSRPSCPRSEQATDQVNASGLPGC